MADVFFGQPGTCSPLLLLQLRPGDRRGAAVRGSRYDQGWLRAGLPTENSVIGRWFQRTDHKKNGYRAERPRACGARPKKPPKHSKPPDYQNKASRKTLEEFPEASSLQPLCNFILLQITVIRTPPENFVYPRMPFCNHISECAKKKLHFQEKTILLSVNES